MSAIKVINGQVFKTDSFEVWRYEPSLTLPQQPVSTDYEIEGLEWFTPFVKGGVVAEYRPSLDAIAPSADSVKTVRLRNAISGQTIWILGEASDWADRVNGCCGDTPDMPTVIMTAPNTTEAPCPTDAGNYEFIVAEQAPVIVGQKLFLYAENDGVAFAPAALAGGHATIAAALAWAQANWGAYGVWSAVGATGIKLSGTTVKKGKLQLTFLAQDWCMVIVAAQTFNQVKNGTKVFDLGQVIAVVDANQVIAAIKDYFADGVLTAFSPTKIQYHGPNVPGGILLNAAVIDAFTAGVCV
jgi:hypothetical protein